MTAPLTTKAFCFDVWTPNGPIVVSADNEDEAREKTAAIGFRVAGRVKLLHKASLHLGNRMKRSRG